MSELQKIISKIPADRQGQIIKMVAEERGTTPEELEVLTGMSRELDEMQVKISNLGVKKEVR